MRQGEIEPVNAQSKCEVEILLMLEEMNVMTNKQIWEMLDSMGPDRPCSWVPFNKAMENLRNLHKVASKKIGKEMHNTLWANKELLEKKIEKRTQLDRVLLHEVRRAISDLLDSMDRDNTALIKRCHILYYELQKLEEKRGRRIIKKKMTMRDGDLTLQDDIGVWLRVFLDVADSFPFDFES